MEQSKKFIRLTTGKPETVIMTMAIPTVISMLVTAIYNMADTYFVSKIRDVSASAAVGIVFPAMAIIQAVGFFFGQGSGNYISRALGQKNTDSALRMASTGFFCSFLIGIIITVLGLCFSEPLSYALGSTPTTLPYTMDYLKYILLGAPFIISSFVINNQLRFQGNATYAMVGLVSGGILNIILDPILIFKLELGISGAAIATSVSQVFSFVLLWIGTLRGGNLRIKLSKFTLKAELFAEIYRGGLPSLCRQGIASVAGVIFNFAAGNLGAMSDFALAASSIINRIIMFVNSAVIGFGQGFQPFCGFNYGAKLYDRVKRGYFFCLIVSTVFLTVTAVGGFIFAEEIITLFRKDKEVIEFGTAVLRFQCCSLPFFGVIIMGNMIMQNLGMVIKATFLATARQGIFFIPLILLLPEIFGVVGLQAAQAAADILAAVCAIPLSISVIKYLKLKSI